MNEKIIKKFKRCALHLSTVANKINLMLIPGADILTISIEADRLLNSGEFKSIMPASFEINNMVNHHCPTAEYILQNRDFISYTIDVSLPGYGKYPKIIVRGAYSKSLSGVEQETISVVREAAIAGANAVAIDRNFSDLRFSIAESLDERAAPITNVCGYDLYDATKLIPNTKIIHPTLQQKPIKIREGDVLFIDVYASDTAYETEAKPFHAFTCLHASTRNHMNTRPALYHVLNCIHQNYGDNMFSARDLPQKYAEYAAGKKIVKFKTLKNYLVHEALKQGYLKGIVGGVIENDTKDGVNAAIHIGKTVLVTKDGPMILS